MTSNMSTSSQKYCIVPKGTESHLQTKEKAPFVFSFYEAEDRFGADTKYQISEFANVTSDLLSQSSNAKAL